MIDNKKSLENNVDNFNLGSKSGSGIIGFPILLAGWGTSILSGLVIGAAYAHDPNIVQLRPAEATKDLSLGPAISFVGGLLTPRIGPLYPGAVAIGLEAASFVAGYGFYKIFR